MVREVDEVKEKEEFEEVKKSMVDDMNNRSKVVSGLRSVIRPFKYIYIFHTFYSSHLDFDGAVHGRQGIPFFSE
ncbi:hypothetical protein EON65_27970 [archaeon]|nr:MAG: hypothetical protein EON65_27970 [archaeon]